LSVLALACEAGQFCPELEKSMKYDLLKECVGTLFHFHFISAIIMASQQPNGVCDGQTGAWGGSIGDGPGDDPAGQDH
ncbi:MAG: hypothetical protein AAB133_09570, partial [Pseudomonadota bacterium]